MMRKMLAGSALMVTLGGVVAMPIAAGADVRSAGRKAVTELGDSVVTLRMVINISMAWGGQDGGSRDRKSNTRATIISADGLAVAPLSDVDPSAMVRRMAGNRQDFKFETKIKEIKVVMADNSEVEYRLVLRDPDMDIAILRPKDPQEKPFTFVDLSKSKEGSHLDEIFTIGRLGDIGRRESAVVTGEVQSVIPRPRRMYIADGETYSMGTGTPVFLSSGEVLGVTLTYAMAGAADMDSEDETTMSVIIPAADILEVAEQAKSMQAEELAPYVPEEETEGEEATEEVEFEMEASE